MPELETELAYYRAHRDEWLKSYRDRFVLVKGEKLIGVFNTQEEALRVGARSFGLNSFLIQRVTETDRPVDIPAYTFGLLGAPSHRQT
jgi:hypothetical protein